MQECEAGCEYRREPRPSGPSDAKRPAPSDDEEEEDEQFEEDEYEDEYEQARMLLSFACPAEAACCLPGTSSEKQLFPLRVASYRRPSCGARLGIMLLPLGSALLTARRLGQLL